MRNLRIYCVFVSLFTTVAIFAQQTISLAGEWDLRIDREDVGLQEQWFNKTITDDKIALPASMPEARKGDVVTAATVWTGSTYDSTYYYSPRMAKYREEGNVKFPFFLTPDYHYVGAAWYQRTITIPKDWKGKHITLFLERPHIETMLWVNGKPAGIQNSLCTPHLYELSSMLEAGKQHTITIRIDNRLKPEYNVGQDSHSVTDQTQGNWNGIVGKMELRSEPITWIHSVQVYPDIEKKEALIKLQIAMNKERKLKGTVTLTATPFNNSVSAPVRTLTAKLPGKKSTLLTTVEFTMAMGDSMLLWDEFNPNLYRLTASLNSFWGTDSKEIEFGMRKIHIVGKDIFVNNRLTMMRGTVENCDFPLTGYAPMDRASWEQVLRKCKEYGLNHMRFHSFCPPAAAFEAADRVGFYMQAEAGSWPNHGVRLGAGFPIDQYLLFEGLRISATYGNHPSFAMFAIGNEPAGRWVDAVADMNAVIKAADARRIYTGASVGGSWQWQPRSEYHVKAGARGLEWARRRPNSIDDYSSWIDTVRQPFISHETGQWCVFPDLSETSQYTGVYKAKNFEIFRDILAENNMSSLAHDFLMASGKLQAICYKYELERTYRTPHYAGFQLLALNDYSGQGSAIVGPLNVFFREKGYIDAEEWGEFCAPTVLLAKLPKFVYTTNETFAVDFEVAHYGESPLRNQTPIVNISNEAGESYNVPMSNGSANSIDIPLGNKIPVGSIAIPLNDKQITKASKYTLRLTLKESGITNHWDFWVYPEVKPVELNTADKNIYIAQTLDSAARATLEKGGKVLLLSAGKVTYGKDVVQQFTPVFWNTSWFKMRPPHTTGLLIDDNHPLFKDFPTAYHSDLQWWELINRTQVMQFTDFPAAFQPTVQSIDTWFLSRKIGVLFEAKVGNGRLLMTTIDLENNLDTRPVATWLRRCLFRYMEGEDFHPRFAIDGDRIADLFTKVAPPIDSYTKSSPDELRPVGANGR